MAVLCALFWVFLSYRFVSFHWLFELQRRILSKDCFLPIVEEPAGITGGGDCDELESATGYFPGL
jgi:hypothetical protein